MRKAALAWVAGAPKEKCAELAGVDYSTFFRWTRSERWPQVVAECLPDMHQEMVRSARAVLMHHLRETKDAKVAMFILSRLAPLEFPAEPAPPEAAPQRVVVTVGGVKPRQRAAG